MGSHFGVGAPPILEPILVGIGMFTGGRRVESCLFPLPFAEMIIYVRFLLLVLKGIDFTTAHLFFFVPVSLSNW